MKQLLVVLLLCVTGIIPSKSEARDPSNVVRIYKGTVDSDGIGTGFFIERYLILTAKHVVTTHGEVLKTVVVKVRGNLIRGKVVATSTSADLALIDMKGALGFGVRPIRFCRKSAVSTGDKVSVLTYDSGVFATKTGMVFLAGHADFEATTRVFWGNSGSPILRGNCAVGILEATYCPADDIKKNFSEDLLMEIGKKSYYVTVFKIKEFLASYNLKRK